MDIKQSILDIADKKQKFKTADVVNSLNKAVTRQYVSLVIRELVEQGKLMKGGSTHNAFYFLPNYISKFGNQAAIRLKNSNLEEHRVFNDLLEKAPFLKDLEENISSILFYAFTEMLNNAIEHSKTEFIELEITRDQKNLTFVVNDFGIGVFKNVMRKRKLTSEIEATQDILKGKTTTMPHSHTGEGIFFTSKVGDVFILDSYGYRLRVDNLIKDVFIEELKPQKRGTKVIFTISLNSTRHLNDIFSKFVSEPGDIGFNKTEILIRLYATGSIYISRSQARRILAGLEKYESIVFDFDRVTTVGQAFADELFRVFKQKHPQVKVHAINMVEPVRFMVDRATA